MRPVLLIVTWIVLGMQWTAACEFCAAPSLTLTEQIAGADVALLVDWQQGREATIGEAGETQFKVRLVVQDATQKWSPGKLVEHAVYVGAEPGEQFLLFATLREEELDWGAPQRISPAAFEYVQQAPPLDAPTHERLAYFLRFLEHPDQGIANDAYGEFAKASYTDIALLKSEFSRENLRTWLVDEAGDKTRRGLYGLMLGLCGNPTDAAFLQHVIVQPTQEFRLGIDGMIAGYLLLTQESGLQVLVETKITNPNAPPTEVQAVINALRFHWAYEHNRIPQANMRAAMRLLLKSSFSELIIPDLARWHDWDAVDELKRLYHDPKSDFPATKRAIVRFLLAASETAPETITPAQRAKAADFLAELRTADPETVEAAERLKFD